MKDLPNPEEYPEEVFVVCLHDGETASENAETVVSWIVKTMEELRTVASTLDRLIATDDYFEEAMWTLVRTPRREDITAENVECVGRDALRDGGRW